MKKQTKLKIIIVMAILYLLLIKMHSTVSADWWQRTDVRPTQPSVPRGEIVFPTNVPNASPTPKTITPSVTPAPTGSSGNTNNGGGGSTSSDDPCASGKSFVGPNCGWSPSVGGSGSSNNAGSNISSGSRIGGPKVRGLSYTGNGDLGLSDIILLVGVLCLLLYVRSKIEIKRLI